MSGQKAKLRLMTPPREAGAPDPMCDEAPYPRYKPGDYEARCVMTRTYVDPQFKRWVCRLEFRLLLEGEPVFAFLNLGNREKPHAGRRSEYRRAWTIASGEQPRKRQAMSPRVFVSKIF